MSILSEKPYIYYFTDEIKSCVTLVNHHERTFKYYSTNVYGFDIDTIILIVSNEIRKLQIKHGDKTFNKLRREVDPITSEDYFSFDLDAPTSVLHSACFRFSDPTMLHANLDNSSMLDILTSYSWKVSLDSNGQYIIDTYNIVPLNETLKLDKLLVDPEKRILYKFSEDPFDYREGRYMVISMNEYKKVLNISKNSDINLSVLVSLSSDNSSSSKPSLIQCDDEEVYQILSACTNDAKFKSIRDKVVCTVHETEDALQIFAISRCQNIQKRKQVKVKKSSYSKEEFTKLIESTKDFIAAKVYLLSVKENVQSKSKITEFLSKYSECSASEMKKFISYLDKTSLYWIKLMYMDNQGSLKSIRHCRKELDDMHKDIKTLVTFGFFVKLPGKRLIDYEPSFLKGIYTHNQRLDIAKYVELSCKVTLSDS